MPDFKEGDKVRVTLDCEVSFVDPAGVHPMEGTADGWVFPLQLTSGVTVERADKPTPYERALTVMADQVADLDATAKRCDDVGRPGVAIERRTEADAVRLVLVSVIEVGGAATDAAIVRAHDLIAEAVKHRG